MKLSCNCGETVPSEAIKGEEVVFAEIERCGYSLIRVRPFRKSDGMPSETFRYLGVDWIYCPFCGQKTVSTMLFSPRRRG